MQQRYKSDLSRISEIVVLMKLIFHYYEILMGKKMVTAKYQLPKYKYNFSIYILQMLFMVFAYEMFIFF